MNELVATLLEDSVQAATSARPLLAAGDTKATVIAEFGRLCVKSGATARKPGKALNDIEEMRLAADYAAVRVTPEDATWAIEQAERFIASGR